MPRQRNALKAGTFILLSAAVTVAVIVGITGTDAIFKPRQTRKLLFTLQDDIGGLQAGDPVRIGGFAVGTVHSIDIVDGSRVEVSISLPAKYVFRENAVADIDGSLIGACWVNFTTLGDGQPLPPGAPIPGHAAGLNATFKQVNALLPKLQNTIALVNEKTLPTLNADLVKAGATADAITRVAGTSNDLVATINSKIDPLMGHVATVSKDASAALTQIKDLSKHVDTDIVPNASAAVATVKEKLPDLMDQTKTLLAQGTTTLDSATSTLSEVKATFGNTTGLTGSLKDVIAGNKSKLEGIIGSLKSTADNLKGASVEIRHSPWRLIYKPAPDEIANLNIYDAARQFAEGAGTLKDSAQALKDASANKNLDEAELKSLITQLDKSFEKFTRAEKALWGAVKE